MDPPGDQNDGLVLEGLNDDFVLKAAVASGKQREPLSDPESDHTVDVLDVVATPPCSEVVRADAAAARPHSAEQSPWSKCAGALEKRGTSSRGESAGDL